MLITPAIIPVILSGGSGTRLWPLSRSQKPKQLLSLTGSETMLQLTARRSAGDPRFSAPVVVGVGSQAAIVQSQLEAIGIEAAALILEPCARNTAPAIALAALAAAPGAALLVMPSDHVIADVPAFRAAIEAAMPAVAEGWLVTFGITPDKPETGYGYIRRGEAVMEGVYRVAAFVEKPDLARAEMFLAEGDYAWNGGIFLFRADSYLAALDRHAPDIAVEARSAMAGARHDGAHIHPDPIAFAACPSESIDYAIMEKADRVAVVPVEMGWSDLGSWDAMYEIAAKDEHGNASRGDVVLIDAADCLVRSDGPLVAAIGVRDLIVVATGDAILVMPRGTSQDVKRAVEALKAKAHPALDRPAA